MSHPEYAEWLVQIGVGWLGFEPEKVWNMRISDILLGYEGKQDMLRYCFGGKKPGPATVDTVEDFDALFGDAE